MLHAVVALVVACLVPGCADDQDSGYVDLPDEGTTFSTGTELADRLGCEDVAVDDGDGMVTCLLGDQPVAIVVFETPDEYDDFVGTSARAMCGPEDATRGNQLPMAAGNRWLVVGEPGTSDEVTSEVIDAIGGALLSLDCS